TGHEMAVEEINGKGGVLGRKLQLVIRDDQSKPDVGVREARDLILKEKVNFLTGIIHSGVALAVSEVAKEYKTILLVSIAKRAAITSRSSSRPSRTASSARPSTWPSARATSTWSSLWGRRRRRACGSRPTTPSTIRTRRPTATS